MIRKWTDAELKDALKDLTIICDTREQDAHCEEWFKKNGVKCKVRKLDTGDYSAMIGDLSLEETVAVERKHNLDEICGNFTAERERFEREFLRAKAYGIKMYLIVENASWADVIIGNYRSRLPAKSLLASLLSWQVRFNVTVIFCEPQNTPKLIHGIFYYAAREQLLHGDIRR